MMITAFSRPADLVVIPAAGSGELVLAAAGAARRVLGLTASLRGHRDLAARLDTGLDPLMRRLARLRPGGPGQLLHAGSSETGQAALAVVTACPVAGCPPPGTDGTGTEPGASHSVLYAACQRVLRPGGMLAVLTAAAGEPGSAGEIVAHARAAGFVYAQHIIAAHSPVRDSKLGSPWRSVPRRAGAAVPPHLAVHSDVLLFSLPAVRRPHRDD